MGGERGVPEVVGISGRDEESLPLEEPSDLLFECEEDEGSEEEDEYSACDCGANGNGLHVSQVGSHVWFLGKYQRFSW